MKKCKSNVPIITGILRIALKKNTKRLEVLEIQRRIKTFKSIDNKNNEEYGREFWNIRKTWCYLIFVKSPQILLERKINKLAQKECKSNYNDEKGDSQGIVSETKICVYRKMVYAQTRTYPRKWMRKILFQTDDRILARKSNLLLIDKKAEKVVEHKGDGDTDRNWSPWNGHQSPQKWFEWIWNQKKNHWKQQDTPEDLRRHCNAYWREKPSVRPEMKNSYGVK